MSVTVGEIINCDSLYIAKILQDDANGFVTGAPSYLAPVGEVKEDPKVSSSSSAYDGAVMFNYYSEGGELTVTVPGLTERKAAEITGKSYDAAKGIVFDSGDLAYIPAYALGFRVEVGSTGGVSYYKYRWFLKGNFQISSTTAKSKGEKVDGQSQEVTFNPLRTVHKWTVPHPTDSSKTITTGLKVTKTDTTDPAFTTEDSWFSQVQTPDTIGKPSVIALSSSVPADDAAGVLATAHPTLTFSNAIASDDILLIKTSDNSIVPVTKSYDTAGKILTITPSANLTASGAYQIIVAGVKDIYGQSFAAQVINFTVAS
jgi:phi13 family phage major tail protein